MSLSDEFGKIKLQDSYAISEKDIIVAIDFGTSRTGVVWGIRKNIPNEELEVQPLDGTGVITEDDKKTLTAILLSKENGNEPIAFGQKARFLYSDDDYENDYFFRCFKMNLHKQFQIDPDIIAANNKSLPLSIIIQKSFEFIKKKILDALNTRNILNSRDPYDIVWSLTVPAIWTDVAKFIMRKAAFNAGMIKPESSDKLIIALEPECAFIGAMKAFKNDSSIYIQNKKFLIVDCGGGTIDITGHQIQTIEPLTVKEIICPDGGHLGSTLIDENFFDFLKDFMGNERYNEISKLQEFVDLEKLCEECKLSFTFDPITSEMTRINLATVFYNFGKDLLRQLVDEWNCKNPNLRIRRFGSHVIGLSYELMMSFFVRPIEDIIGKVERVINDNGIELSNLDYIILAGGFCKNKYLIRKMNEIFHDGKGIRILISKEPDLLIVRGAAIYGCDPSSIIKIRKAKYTFGINCSKKYDPENLRHVKYKHKTYIRNGVTRLEIFHKFGTIGDDIKVGENIPSTKFFPIDIDHVDALVNIIISSENDPVSIYEDSVKILAVADDIQFDMNVPFDKRGIRVSFSFGSSEIACSICSLTGEFIRRITLDYSKFFG